jgi:uncharacterized protein (DUF1800 family)
MKKTTFIRFAGVAMFSAFFCVAHAQSQALTPTAAARILEQATWGPTPASVTQLQTLGFDQWFANQVAAPITTYSNQPMLGSDGKAFGNLSGLQVQFFENALYNPDQLRQRVAFALSEIWVVSKSSTIGYAAAFPPLLNIFQNDAFGSYATLMTDVTLNPAMGQYLDMVNNHKSTATYSANENYGRELMQLFTVGLSVLNQDGSLALDKTGNAVPTYSAATVTAMSAALTGWTFAATPAGGTSPNYFSPMVVLSTGTQHDVTKKTLSFPYPDGTVHTTTLPANQTAQQDLQGALAALTANPTMAPFVSKQLIQHLVTSNPSAGYVSRIATVFTSSNGNLQSVVYAILTDQEARAGDAVNGDISSFGHLREPVLWVENLLRGMNGTVYDSSTVYNYTSGLGQNLLYEPSVFSYFSPEYHAGPLLGPEFQLHTTQTAVTRANYTYSLIYGGKLDANTLFDISSFVTAATASTAALENAINNQFFHGMMSTTLQTAIGKGLTGLTTPTTKAQAALYIALTSSEFQVIH